MKKPTYDFTLCSNFTDYDSKLEIFTNDQDCITPVSTGNYNDDDYTNCPDYVAPYPPSGLWAVTLQPGQYYVVVDGFGGATGNYEISISITGAGPMMAMPIIQSEQYGLQRSIK
ncbi:hypothetical protein Ct9H90mP12_2740 [bacterium]|nr:MAG: hypothetical protein Ct9H90mP12_2740 [bacterium]